MIARVLALGRSFKKLISYLKTGKDGQQLQRDRVEWVEFRNLPTRNPDTAACMMAATASESVSGTQTAVYHFSISCDPGDPVDGGTLRRVADRTIRDLGLEEHQVLIFAHKDRSHPHLHFVVNRVHPERGTLWRTWRDYYRIERSLRAQEQELGLHIVPGWNSVVVRNADGRLRVPAEHETGLQRVYPASNPRRGDAEFLRDVRAGAAQLLEQARGWAELERGLAEQGLSLRVKGGGFTLTDGPREVKASEVGHGCSRYHLEKRLGSYPDYRARMAVAQLPPAPRAPIVQPEVAPPRESATVEARAPARPELPAPPLPPTTQVPPRVEGRVRERRKPQFGDAGHGIIELFGGPSTPEVERPAPAVERAPAPQPQRKERTFLREVQNRAGPVLERAGTWAELERGLADHGLSLREKGGGFVVTDGEREVKASEVGRAFSRFHLEKRFGCFPGVGASKAQPEFPAQAGTGAAPPEPVVSPAVEADLTPPAVASPVPTLEPDCARSTRADEQLAITFDEQPTPTPPPTHGMGPGEPVQLGLPLVEPPAPPRRLEKRSPTPPPVRPVESPTPTPGVVPHVPAEATPGPSAPPSENTRRVRPIESQPPSGSEPERPQSRVSLPPELIRAGELLRKGLAFYEAERVEWATRAAADAAAAKLDQLKMLDETASGDATHLRETLGRVFTDSWEATHEIGRFVQTHGWRELRSTLTQSPQQFGKLRYPRPWYTLGPGRKDVEAILDPLKIAMKSERERPTQSQLDAAKVDVRETARIYNDARNARHAMRYPAQYENEAAAALRPLLQGASPEWVARQLALLLPPEDREAAQMAQRVLSVALGANRTLTREKTPDRGIDF